MAHSTGGPFWVFRCNLLKLHATYGFKCEYSFVCFRLLPTSKHYNKIMFLAQCLYKTVSNIDFSLEQVFGNKYNFLKGLCKDKNMH